MRLFRETGTFIAWYGAVLGTLVRARPLTTVALVLYSVGSKIANMMARLLPLKVILLAGSDGVPSYFRPFLSPEQKTLGLIVLVVATVICYIADPVLDALANKLAESGSRRVVENANDIVLTEHRQKAQSTYIDVAGMTAELLFALVFFSVIMRSNPPLFLLLIVFFAIMFAATAWILSGNIYEGHRPSGYLHFGGVRRLSGYSVDIYICRSVSVHHRAVPDRRQRQHPDRDAGDHLSSPNVEGADALGRRRGQAGQPAITR